MPTVNANDATAQVAGNPAGRVSRLLALQCCMLDALCVPLKMIQERIGHALTGSFTLDVYGSQLEWGRNLEAAQSLGAELERAVNEAVEKLQNQANAELVVGLSPIKEKGSGVVIS